MLHFRQLNAQLKQFGRSPQARLSGLISLLRGYPLCSAKNHTDAQLLDLSSDDVDVLKQLIYSETKKIKNVDAEILCEQILLLVLGALKMQTSANTDHVWNMVDDAVASFSQPEKTRLGKLNWMSFSVIFLILSWMTIQLLLRQETQARFYPDEISQSEMRLNTINHLIAMHNEMNKGSCQLPQAAMLQSKQRESYISFINHGQVNIDSAEDLKQALTFVNCLYPQKLMDNPLNH